MSRVHRRMALAALGLLTAVLLLGGCGGGGSLAHGTQPKGSIAPAELWPRLFADQRPQVVDIRPADSYAWAHIPYSENRPGGEGLLATAVRGAQQRPLVLVAASEAEELALAARLEAAGRPAAVLQGGLDNWSLGLDVCAALLQRWIQEGRAMTMIDVREPEEYAQGHIPGSINRPLDQLDTWAQRLCGRCEYVLICRLGGRSAAARDQLARRGFQHVHNLLGGVEHWPYGLETGS
jgi:rhodanese-related sulfurtransferase